MSLFHKGKTICYILLLMLFTGCKGKEQNTSAADKKKDTATYVLPDSTTPDTVTEPELLATLYELSTVGGETIKIAASERSEQNPFFLSGDANYMVAVKYLDSKIIKADTLLINEFSYTEIDSSQIIQIKKGNNEYLLLTANETFKGQAITGKTVNFILVDVNSLDHYTLVYEGHSSIRCYECIDGMFKANPLLGKNPVIKDILYEYANKSKWVYRPASQEQKDARYFINYEQKWNEDNKADNNLANGHSSVPPVIYSTYYKEDLFTLTAKHVGTFTTIENDRFIVTSFFRGNILAFDKQQQLYFPVDIEGCFTGCDKQVKFTRGNLIEVLYDEYSANEVYTIDLDKIHFN